MMRLVFSKDTEKDFEDIGDYIAEGNAMRAVTFIRELREQCHRLIPHPHMGVLREEYGTGLRMLAYGRYLIFYSVSDTDILIERVLHSARYIGDILD